MLAEFVKALADNLVQHRFTHHTHLLPCDLSLASRSRVRTRLRSAHVAQRLPSIQLMHARGRPTGLAGAPRARSLRIQCFSTHGPHRQPWTALLLQSAQRPSARRSALVIVPHCGHTEPLLA